MISRLSINGFKGFERLDIPKLSMITLLGGRNNVGKTTVLEALFMFHDRLNPQMILRQFAWRGVASIGFQPDSMWAPVFNNYDLHKKIEIEAQIDGKEERMILNYNPSFIPATIPVTDIRPGFRAAHIRTDQKPEPSFSLDISYYKEKKEIMAAHLLMGRDGFGMHVDKATNHLRQAVFIPAKSVINPMEDAQRFGQLDILGKQEKIVEFLRIIEPRLKSLSVVAMGDTSLIHGDVGLSRKIPLAYMGDGVSRLMSIILAIATSNGGIVMIDECENGIHYSVLPKIWEAMAKAAREYNCQVVCTTHSYECLMASCEGISGGMADDFGFVRIDHVNGKTIAKCFDHDMLKAAIESNMEVR